MSMLDVGDGHRIRYDVSGNPDGTPAVVLHGGPGSGAGPGWRRFFDPSAYRVVLFDQRGCGGSTPNAGDIGTDLSTITTHHLIADVERLRAHLGIERWVLLGASWGTTLALAYAQRHPSAVRAIVLFAVCDTSRAAVEWITRGVGEHLPREWARFRDGAAPADRDGDLAAAYARLLADPDPAVRERAARDWCDWEDRHVAIARPYRPDPHYDDPAFRMCFARQVTHFWSHAAWLPDGDLLGRAPALAGIPGVLVHGRQDVSGPPDFAIALAAAWPDARLVLVDDAGHGDGGIGAEVAAALDGFRTAGATAAG